MAASLQEEGGRLEADAQSLGCHGLEAGLGLVSSEETPWAVKQKKDMVGI